MFYHLVQQSLHPRKAKLYPWQHVHARQVDEGGVMIT